jgi:hypothetical protein
MHAAPTTRDTGNGWAFEPLPLTEAVAVAQAALAAATPPDSADDTTITAAIADLQAHVAAAHALQSECIATADRRELAQQQGARRTQTWLQELCRLDPGEANGRVQIARALSADGDDPLSTTRRALADGAINVDHADVITSWVRKLPASCATPTYIADFETRLAREARRTSPSGVRKLAAHLVAELDQQRAVLDEHEQHEARALRCSTNRDGMLVVKALLGKEAGAKLMTALDPLAKPQPADDGQLDPRTAAQRQADALETLVDIALESDGLPITGGQRPQLQIAVDYDPLANALRSGVLCRTGETVTPETVRRLSCDAGIMPLVLGSDGLPLDLGRTERSAPAHLRVALERRDGACAFPSCEQPPGTSHAHHMVHWVDGGATDRDNLVMLCGRHHRQVHHEGWEVRIRDGRPAFIPPVRIDPDQVPRPGRRGEHLVHRDCLRELVRARTGPIPPPRDPQVAEGRST